MSAMLGRRASCSIGGRLRFLLPSNNSSRLLCTSQVNSSISNISHKFDQRTHEIFQRNRTRTSLFPAISAHLSAHEGTVDAANIAYLYSSAASIGQSMDSKNTKQILEIVRKHKNEEWMQFSMDNVKDFFQGHRYTDDKSKDVRLLLTEVLPNPKEKKKIIFDSQRKLGLSLFGLQNMTAFHPEVRSVLRTLTYYLARCPETLDGSCISGALFGTRSMNTAEPEVINFLKVITQKIKETTFDMSPAGAARSFNSLQMKGGQRKEILDLLAALNGHIGHACERMSASEVCHALNGLQSMTSQSPIVIESVQLLTSRFVNKDVQRALTPHDLALALGSLKRMGCSTQETNFLMKNIDERIQKLKKPMSPKDLVIAFSGLKNMRSTQAGVSSLLSTLTSNMLLLLHSDAVPTVPTFLFPNVLRNLKNMSSDEIAVRNFLSVATDVLSEQEDVQLSSMEYMMCMVGLKNMKSSEATVRRFLSCLMKCYLQNSSKDLMFDWGHICCILEGMSSMNNDSHEVRQILDLLAKSIEQLNKSGTDNDNDQCINAISSGMYSLRKMNASPDVISRENVKFIYLSLFQKLKERCAVASSNQGAGKKTLISSLGSLPALSSFDVSLSSEVMLYLSSMIKGHKQMAMASLYGHEVSACLAGISSRPHTCKAADTLLRTFLLALSSDTIRFFEADISNFMMKMKYPKDIIADLMHQMKNRSVIGEAEMNAHFKKSLSLPESLNSLQESVSDCVDGDAIDIFWSSSILKLIKAHDAAKFSTYNVASLVQSSSEFSQLFFSKHKREAMILRQNFMELTFSVLKKSSPIYTQNFEDFYTVLCGTECVWKKNGNKYGNDIIETMLDPFKQSLFKLTISDAAKITSLLKKTNSDHPHVHNLLSIVNDKVDYSGSNDTTTSSQTAEFVSAVRGLRFLLNNSSNARKLFDHFIQQAENSDLVLNIDDLLVAICAFKNSSSEHEEVHRALRFFRYQLSKYNKSDVKFAHLVSMLSYLRFMDSSTEQVCLFVDQIQKLLPDHDLGTISVNHELLCNFIQFFNHKQCDDSPAISNLRDSFTGLLENIKNLDTFSLKVVEHMVALKSKRSHDAAGMNSVYGSMAMRIICSEHPQKQATPNMFCIGLLGLETMYDSEGIESIVSFCDKLNSCETEFSFQNIMLALSALESNSVLLQNGAAMDLVLSSLAKKAVDNKSTFKAKFATVLSALRSLAVLSPASDAISDIYSVLTDILTLEDLSQHRVSKVLETIQDADTSKPEIQKLLRLLFDRIQNISAENYEKKNVLSMILFLEKMDENEVVQEMKDEILFQFKHNAHSVSQEDTRSLEAVKSLLLREGAQK
jgi:hypothetical protein